MKLIITETQYRKLQRHLRKQELNEESLGKKVGRNIGMAALGAGLTLGSPEAKGQDYVNPNYQSTSVSRNDDVVIKNGRKLEYILSQIHNNYGANDEKLSVQPTLDSIKNAIKKHLEINAVISEDVFREFIERIKSGKSKYGVKQFNGKTILIWKEED
jgi:stalled ribosome alternative rescue factor ArfA